MSCDPIQRILVVGTDRLAGAALADRWEQRYEVVRHGSDSAEHCESILAAADADLVVYCGAASEPSWSPAAAADLSESTASTAASWAALSGKRFVAVASDAVFTGPYMFHDEASAHACPSREAQILARTEHAIRDANDSALIVRTHLFAPSSNADGMIERILAGDDVLVAGSGHATPIYAADLADLLECAVVAEASGIMHIAGAERISPAAFVERLREAFDLPRRTTALVVGDHASGFATGDRGLVCGEARERLGLAMPLLTEAFARMRSAMESRHSAPVRAAA